MSKRTICAAIIGAVLLTAGIILRKVAEQEGLQILLFLLSFPVMGLAVAGVKRAFLLGLVMGLVFTLVNGFVNNQVSFESGGVAAASILVSVLIPSLVGSGLSTLGGLIGRFVFKPRQRAQ